MRLTREWQGNNQTTFFGGRVAVIRIWIMWEDRPVNLSGIGEGEFPIMVGDGGLSGLLAREIREFSGAAIRETDGAFRIRNEGQMGGGGASVGSWFHETRANRNRFVVDDFKRELSDGTGGGDRLRPTTFRGLVDRAGVGGVGDVDCGCEVGISARAGRFEETGVTYGHRAPEGLDLGVAAAEDEAGIAMVDAGEILAVLNEPAGPAGSAIGGETDDPGVFAGDE